MTGEFTYYTLFLLLAITTGVVFQFFLGQLRKLKKDMSKMNKSIVELHTTVNDIKNSGRSKSSQRIVHHRSPTPKRLEGNLELEYQGARAQTKATFYIDKEM